MKVWVTRDSEGLSGKSVDIHPLEPILDSGDYYSDGWQTIHLLDTEFIGFFGFTPRKGSCKQMNLTLTEIE